MANQMNLLKFRNYNKHDVVNLYSTAESPLTKGTLVEFVSADPDDHNGFGDTFSNVPSYAFSKDYVVKWKVTAAAAGSQKIAGMLLHDVVTTINDPWSMDARLVDPAKLAEKQMVVSGRAAPFVTRGWFEISGFDTASGVPAPGSGAYLSHSGNGIIAVGHANTSLDVRPRVGTFMTSSGDYGGAVSKLQLPK